MIGQQFCLEYLVPIALDRLAENPLAEGDFHMGDLLTNVLTIDSGFWSDHLELKEELDMIILDLNSALEDLLPLIQKYQSNR